MARSRAFASRARVRAGWTGAVAIAVFVLLVGMQSGSPPLGSILVTLALTAWLPLVATAIPLPPRRARAGYRLASITFAVVLAYGVVFAVRQRSSVTGYALVIVLSLLAGLVTLVWVRRGAARDGARRHRYPDATPGTWLAVSRLGALIAAGVLVAIGFRSVPPGLRAESPSPAARVIVWAVDGVGADDVSYYASLRPNSELASLVSTGATAYVAWDPSPTRRTWQRLWSPPALHARPTTRESVRREVIRHWPLAASGGDRPSRLTAVDVVAATGADVARVGWWGEIARQPTTGPNIAEGTWSEIRRQEGRDPTLPRLPLPGSAWMSPRLRELARLPSEEWRMGAETGEADRAIFATAEAVRADPVTWWVDRFRARATLTLIEETDYRLYLTYLDYGIGVSASAGDDLSSQFARRDAIVAYLDGLDPQLGRLRHSLRAGDTLLLVGSPAPGPSTMARGVAVLFGEKVRPETSLRTVPSPDDLRATILYLLGVPLSLEWEGDVVWEALVDGLETNRPPGRVARYPAGNQGIRPAQN